MKKENDLINGENKNLKSSLIEYKEEIFNLSAKIQNVNDD